MRRRRATGTHHLEVRNALAKRRARATFCIMKMNIGIPAADRERLSSELAKFMADTYTLYLKTHSFHWNVTGPMFQTLHLMFEEHYNEMWIAVDAIAERIRALGQYAPGSYAAFTKLSSISDTEDVPEAHDMIRLLVEGHEAVIRNARRLVPIANEVSDDSTADLIIQRLRVHEKTAWMLRSLLDE